MGSQRVLASMFQSPLGNRAFGLDPTSPFGLQSTQWRIWNGDIRAIPAMLDANVEAHNWFLRLGEKKVRRQWKWGGIWEAGITMQVWRSYLAIQDVEIRSWSLRLRGRKVLAVSRNRQEPAMITSMDISEQFSLKCVNVREDKARCQHESEVVSGNGIH